MRLDQLNALDAQAAARALLACCGSTRWADAMAAARPFSSIEAVRDASDAVWSSLDPADWREAFAAHPRIGDRAHEPRSAAEAGWSADEQAGVTEDSRARFARLNREYEQRFGYIFIICATGRGADEMLRALERRMGNNPEHELQEAAEEQRRIARLRLGKLLQ